jgi:SAM-dependent methyltransferase
MRVRVPTGRAKMFPVPDDQNLSAMRAYYELGEEEARLADGAVGHLEFERTKEIVLRHLPPPPAVVADIGGGPGRYSHWLAGLGYQVRHRDLMPLHVTQLQQTREANAHIDSAVADARDLDLADASVDAVLLLGPLYHLDQHRDRVAALAEARRIARPGGPVFAAAINRWAMRLDDVLRRRRYQQIPDLEEKLEPLERTGRITPLYPGSFVGYTHRPEELRAEVRAAGLQLASLVSVEGPAFLLGDLPERLADPGDRRVVLDTIRALEQVPELLGAGTHLLATAHAEPHPA